MRATVAAWDVTALIDETIDVVASVLSGRVVAETLVAANGCAKRVSVVYRPPPQW